MSNCYAILFHPRSGSSWLSDLCDNRPEMVNHYEILSCHGARDAGFISQDLTDQAYDAYEQKRTISRLLEESNQYPNIITGFKFAPYQCRNPAMILAQLGLHDVKVIVLYRQDLIATAVSQIAAQQLAQETNLANIVVNNPSDKIVTANKRKRRIIVDPDALEYHLYDMALEREKVLLYSRTIHQERRLLLSYEDIVADPSGVLSSVAQFLGGKPKSLSNSRVRQHLKGGYQSYIKNQKEFQQFLHQPSICRILREFGRVVPEQANSSRI